MKQVVASMAGSVWKILVDVGDQVEEDQDVAILESMKMEIPIMAEAKGIVKQIHAKEGDFVNEGDRLLELK